MEAIQKMKMYLNTGFFFILMSYLLVGGDNVLAQPQNGFDMGKLYDSAINRYLFPLADSHESILYLEKPSFEPEYAIRFTVFKDSIKLEVNSFKENYFGQLVGHIQKFKNADFEPELEHYAVLVSKKIYEKMKSLFSQTMKSKLSYPSSRDKLTVEVDGTGYLFRLINGENLSWELREPKSNSIPFKTAAICKEIAISLKNNNFNEMTIVKTIDHAGF